MTDLHEHLHIPTPCHADPAALHPVDHGVDRGRALYCDTCAKKVHQISRMTEAEVRALFQREPQPCVRYAMDAEGYILLQPDHAPPKLRTLAQRAGGVATAVVLAACQPDSRPAKKQAPPVVLSDGPDRAPQTPAPKGQTREANESPDPGVARWSNP